MLFIIGVFEFWIMLGDFSVFSDTNFIIYLMHHIPTAVICGVIDIRCYD